MKKVKLTLFIVASLCYYSAWSQSDAATYFAKYLSATKYYSGEGLPVNHEKAFKLMKECAEDGNMDEAMLKLAAMYQFGIGTQKSDQEAFFWINQSSNKGNTTAHYQLGRMYKDGCGVEQNFEEARKAFKKSADAGDARGKYKLGYMYHRGLGGEQNYQKAVELFTQSDTEGVTAASHMLAICYKNGYGVEKDHEKSDYFLDKAIKKNIKDSHKEKQNIKSEVNEQRDKQYKEHVLTYNLSGEDVSQKNMKRSISGEWQGKQYTFDWSKEHILEEASLKLIITEKDSSFSGQWYENDILLLNFTGKIIKNVMVFDKTEFTVADKYGNEGKMYFTKAKLEMLMTNKKYLAGEIESYVPTINEPGYPMLIVAQRQKQKNDQQQDTTAQEITTAIAENIEKSAVVTIDTTKQNPAEQDALVSFIKDKDEMFIAYPNPTTGILNIDYTLNESSKVFLSAYDYNGRMMIKKELHENQLGFNSHRLDFNMHPGIYIVILDINGRTYSKIITKK